MLSSVFNVGDRPHVRLGDVHPPATLPPAHVSRLARSLGGRCDFTVQVAGYGSGGCSLGMA